MKMFEIIVKDQVGELELSCAMDGDNEGLEQAEIDYANGVDPNESAPVLNAIDLYSSIAAEDFARGYEYLPGLIPEDQRCIYDCFWYYWIDEPLRWSDDPDAPWRMYPKIGCGLKIKICTCNDITKNHIIEWMSKNTSLCDYKPVIRYLGRSSKFNGWSDPFIPLARHLIDGCADNAIFIE